MATLLEQMLGALAERDGDIYRVEWGEPIREPVTFYEPTVYSTPKQPPIETRDDG